jgi:hypothetical protein
MPYFKGQTGGHYYDVTGKPQYDATLSVARKRGYLPSPTTISKVKANKHLEDWRLNEILKHMVAMVTRDGGEKLSPDEWAKLAVSNFWEERNAVTDFGTSLHDMAERRIKGLEAMMGDEPESLKKLWEPVEEWMLARKPVGVTEETLVSLKHGYAGRTDFIGTLEGLAGTYVVDFKTQGIKKMRQRKPRSDQWTFYGKGMIYANAYDDWAPQITAYQAAWYERTGDLPRCMNVAISSTPERPGVAEYHWSEEQEHTGWMIFQDMLSLWYHTNDFPKPYEVSK